MKPLMLLCTTIVITILFYYGKKIDKCIGLYIYKKTQKNIKDIDKNISFDDFYDILRKEFLFFSPRISKKSSNDYKIIKIKFIFHYISIQYNINKKEVDSKNKIESILFQTKKTHKILKNTLI